MVELGAIKLAVFGSCYRGIHLLDSLLDLESRHPNVAVVTGLCTDNTVSSDAKVSAGKRVWQYIPDEIRQSFMLQCSYIALERGVPVFTGEVKTAGFRDDILPKVFAPDVIFMATFGQRIDPSIYQQARLGMYNFHASSVYPVDGELPLRASSAEQGSRLRYPGPNPFEDMLKAGEKFTRMTVHAVDEKFDNGAIIGYSPPLCIELEQPELWTRAEHIIVLHRRTAAFAAEMAGLLAIELNRTGKPVKTLDFESKFTSHPLWPIEAAKHCAPIPGAPSDHIRHPVEN
jgi:hypothetical protein